MWKYSNLSEGWGKMYFRGEIKDWIRFRGSLDEFIMECWYVG